MSKFTVLVPAAYVGEKPGAEIESFRLAESLEYKKQSGRPNKDVKKLNGELGKLTKQSGSWTSDDTFVLEVLPDGKAWATANIEGNTWENVSKYFASQENENVRLHVTNWIREGMRLHHKARFMKCKKARLYFFDSIDEQVYELIKLMGASIELLDFNSTVLPSSFKRLPISEVFVAEIDLAQNKKISSKELSGVYDECTTRYSRLEKLSKKPKRTKGLATEVVFNTEVDDRANSLFFGSAELHIAMKIRFDELVQIVL